MTNTPTPKNSKSISLKSTTKISQKHTCAGLNEHLFIHNTAKLHTIHYLP